MDENRDRPDRPTETNGQMPPANGHDHANQRSASVIDRLAAQKDDQRIGQILTAVRDFAKILVSPLQERVSALMKQLSHATARCEQAEARVKELQKALDTQTVEHRRIIEALVAQIPKRRF